MIGAIIGDIVGSCYEFAPTKHYNFELLPKGSDITDDSIMCIAVADALINGLPFQQCLLEWGRKYPNPKGSYGGNFGAWLRSPYPTPYNSFGNGSAMRVAPIGWAFDNLKATMETAYMSAECTHNHPEGIKGAAATAAAIFLARTGTPKEEIKRYIEVQFSYDLSFDLQERRRTGGFDESCMGTVPVAIKCYLESNGFEDAIRQAVSMGGDADTLGCITGAIAEAGYGKESIPTLLATVAIAKLRPDMRAVLAEFEQRFEGI